MSEITRLEAIESKLAHLERAVAELNDVIVRQQTELQLTQARHRQLRDQFDSLDVSAGANAASDERPPHY